MKASIMTLVLALSLLFNVFFIAGYLRARAEADDVQQVVARELGLDDVQSEYFLQLQRSGEEDASLYRDSIALVRQDLVEELGRDDRDLQRMRDLVERQQEIQREWKLMETARFHEFMTSLSSDQRRRAADMCRGDWRRRRHGEMLRRFDTDGDGALDEQERQAAEAFMQQRREERSRKWRHRMREQFDANDDGVLDDEEKAAAEAFMEQRRGEEKQMREELRRRFDTNGDGQLDPEEREAVQQWFQENRSQDHPEGRGPRRGPRREPPGDF